MAKGMTGSRCQPEHPVGVYGEDPFRAIFGLELDCGKLWRRGGFRCFLGGWLVVENARKVFFF